MAQGTCENPDCTVAATGTCLLSHANLGECPHFRSGESTGDVVVPKTEPAAAVPDITITEKKSGRTFHLGAELGVEDALEVTSARYGHLIGVLGSTDAGKTCFLSSLYLMASGGTLPAPYQFAGSLSLQAFEDRARGLRDWKEGQLPSQLADHTILSDPRQPSLLHFAIRQSQGERRRFDLLLTDLPGEWTDNLVLRSTHAEAFRFLQRADGIILVVDGTLLMSDEHRHTELQRMRYFTERLANDVNVARDTPFVILVSKSDEIGMQIPPAANELRDHVVTLGFPATTISAAAFSRTPNTVKSGTGVFSAIETILCYPIARNGTPSSVDGQEQNMRTFRRFRG